MSTRVCIDAWLAVQFAKDPLAVLTEQVGQDLAIHVANTASVYFRALQRECAAHDWWDAPISHPATNRALRIDPGQFGATYALAPFRLVRTDKGPRIAAAWPCPKMTDRDWLDIDTVIHWNPVTNEVHIPEDAGATQAGQFDPAHDHGTIYADPRAYFQAWAKSRAIWFAQWSASKGKSWTAAPNEVDHCPGVLILADPAKVRFTPSTMPDVIECVGIDPALVNRAIMRSARLPRASQSMRAAA